MIIICIQGGGECICVYVMLSRKTGSLKQLNRDVVVSMKSPRRQAFALNADNAPSRQGKSAKDFFASMVNILKVRASSPLRDL